MKFLLAFISLFLLTAVSKQSMAQDLVLAPDARIQFVQSSGSPNNLIMGQFGTQFQFIKQNPTNNTNNVVFKINSFGSPAQGGRFEFDPKSAGGGSRVKTFIDEYGVRIGNFSSTIVGPKLVVDGEARFEKVIVKTPVWPDYVFEEDYDLLSLSELEVFIDSNGHLPNIPSEEKVAVDGVDLGSTAALLLEKVEELTLHIIAQDKQIKELLQAVKELQ